MSLLTEQIIAALSDKANPEKAAFFPRFFKSTPGGYGEGDQFLGVIVPEQRKVAKVVFKEISFSEIAELLQNPYHEVRLTAIYILVYKYQKLKINADQKELVDFYLDHLDYVNNWDLVDSSCYHILGHYYQDKDKSQIYEIAENDNLWKQRVAMISSMYWIKSGQFDEAIALAEKLLYHEHDLIHTAVGWMLREIGNKDFEVEMGFLRKRYSTMPRTALRYAIEKFDPELRQQLLKGKLK
ncbi:3-methyladenine DNA glycosylase AlkD [Algoriphagus ratkowskyi]|uniref:3-methyladenine DNA glycosylase AlkD n=1 Tax=Algoriphagus ratkowskyi TaxID=57028 RepID=A0A2W7RHU7_9BACT|nr:DNA alkylation repair protein [Algoriphagus ratkowskyi]PZX59801.1 3-methyladenine DNA glycosylase AlkD [Algoriphagus ratkowskyi]TXD78489.1 DNA alkylation repair protein [Algoriphagus ratkowskyi]